MQHSFLRNNSVYFITIGPRQANLYFLPMRTAKVQVSLRICAVSPEPPLLAHTIRESRRTFRQKPRSLAPLNGWACAVKICHDGMLEDTKLLDGAQFSITFWKDLQVSALHKLNYFTQGFWMEGILSKFKLNTRFWYMSIMYLLCSLFPSLQPPFYSSVITVRECWG